MTVTCLGFGYVRGYYRFLYPQIILEEAHLGIGCGFREVDYKSGGRISQVLFAPMHFLDRQIRPAYWNAYSTLDDAPSTREE